MKIKNLLKTLPILLFTLVSCDFSLNLSLDLSNRSENASSFNEGTSSFISNESIFSEEYSSISSEVLDVTYDLSIHFLELGNKYSGDSIYIKAAETDILIDAGSRYDSASTITSYINNYCDDNKLEYVIATHAHQDHIAAFVGDNSHPGIFKSFEIETIIDFPRTNSTTIVYNSYRSLREELVKKGTKHYTALECWNNENGASRTIEIADNITLNILYQQYYDTKTSNENDYSVCVLLSQGDNHFLFTGDLEEKGEQSLALSNKLPHVKVFKGGHHGSGTSNTDILLNAITPENVCICTCAGTSEYTSYEANKFPYQETINRLAKHTENIYVTSQIDLDKSTSSTYYTKSMNGNIVVHSSTNDIKIIGSNNSLKLKDTDWFKKYRTWPY